MKFVLRFVFPILAIAGIGSGSADVLLQKASGESSPDVGLRIQKKGADPWIYREGDTIYYLHTTGYDIKIWTAPELSLLSSSKPKVIWKPSSKFKRKLRSASKNIWAPELHRFNDRWYIYFAADNGRNENHRMYVLESNKGPLGPYTFKGKLAPKGEDFWAIDGTPFSYNGQLYFIWSGWPGRENGRQDLYIAKMKNPWTLEGKRTKISSPDRPWESWINEGPQPLINGKDVFLIYSANLSWTDDYKLGMLMLKGEDPLKPESWQKRSDPVFESSGDIFGPGHCSFLHDPSAQTNYIVYHVARKKGSGWDREVRAQTWRWSEDGTPNFGRPIPLQ